MLALPAIAVKVGSQSVLRRDAEAFFSARTLDLGLVSPGLQTVNFYFDLTANGDPPGFSMAFDALATSTTSPVPEPSTWAMMLAGFAGLGLAGWRGRASKPAQA